MEQQKVEREQRNILAKKALTAAKEALDAVERGFIDHPFLTRHDPFFRSLRSDPRFAQLMEGVRVRWEGFEA